MEQDGEAGPLIGGLINLVAYLSAMLAISLGTSSQALLGAFIADDGDWNVGGRS